MSAIDALASKQTDLFKKMKNEMPITVEETKKMIADRIVRKEELLTSVRDNLSDNGKKIEDEIQHLREMLEKVEKTDVGAMKVVNMKENTSTVEEKGKTDIKVNNEEKDSDELSSLMDKLTQRFSSLGFEEDDNDYTPSPEMKEEWKILLMGEEEYESRGGKERLKVELMSLEDSSEIEKVSFDIDIII